jgi:hypothetical protein
MLPSSITAIILAAILFEGFFLPSSLTTAQLPQQQQEQQQQTTTTPPSSSLSITTIPPLTPQELEQQNRLQSTIAATTRDLNETEKQVSGVVFTPRWSEPIWVNANSIAVLVAYCLPGEFADSGQEILGGFELEVLESYAVDLPQGFMAWMAVVGNQADVQNGRRLPAALGVICASDLNRADTRVLSPQEQQEINNVISQFSTIQNTQITNIDQVINIIDNVTEPTTEGQPLRAEIIIANTTRAINNATNYKFDADVTGGTPPYNYHWRWIGPFGPIEGLPESNRSFSAFLQLVGTHTIILNVTDSKNQTAYDTLQITVGGPPTNDTGGTTTEGQPLTVEAITNVTEAYGPVWIKFDANVRGGTPPYTYSWSDSGLGIIEKSEKSFTQFFDQPSCNPPNLYCNEPFLFEIKVTDSKGQTASDDGGVNILTETLTVEIIPNATSGFTLDRFELKSNVRGGTPPYTYSWIFSGDFQNFAAACNTLEDPTAVPDNSCIVFDTNIPGEHQVLLNADDSKGRNSIGEILITVEPRPPGGEMLLLPETGEGEGGEPPGGLLPGTPPPSNDTGEEAVSPPEEEGGGESPTETGEEGEEPSAPPGDDDTGDEEEEGGESPPDEEPTTPPG